MVFKRENNKNLHEFRKKANSGDIEARYMLGVNTFIGRQIEYGHPAIENRLQLSEYDSFSNSNSGVVATHTSVSVTETKKISVVHDGQTITTIFNFLNSVIMSIRTVADTIKLERNPDKGLEYLKEGSVKGDKNCSFQLAKYYSGASETMINPTPNKEEASKYLTLAANQGSNTARGILTEGGEFGDFIFEKQPLTNTAALR